MKTFELNKRFRPYARKKDIWEGNTHIVFRTDNVTLETICEEKISNEYVIEEEDIKEISCQKCIENYNKKFRKATTLESDALAFLNGLREEGTTNMFGAAPILCEIFEIEKKEARKLLALWMDNFNNQVDYVNVFDRKAK